MFKIRGKEDNSIPTVFEMEIDADGDIAVLANRVIILWIRNKQGTILLANLTDDELKELPQLRFCNQRVAVE